MFKNMIKKIKQGIANASIDDDVYVRYVRTEYPNEWACMNNNPAEARAFILAQRGIY